ncbi:MAG: polysulfide reductase NrfD [Proteobacteria bacterium]|nr:polysulfide reductase NrfD [Pseudomonadota bacterium]
MDMSYREATRSVSGAILEPVGRRWWLSLVASLVLVLVMLAAVGWLFIEGVGIWGINSASVWGFAIAAYVWWIGIGNAGTLISAMLLLTRQRWRASINRFAEAMTIFAAAIAGLYPILHLGRPYLFYWLVPYPNVMTVWPQWRSPLIWDLFAIASYLIFSIMFWYVGLIPDLATIRDKAASPGVRKVYGALSLGWRGSARQWQALESYYWAMAALGVPLVVSLHSVVGLDFAAGLMPGWQETIFPPYFVVGAMYSGFAMVVTLAIPIRAGLRLERLVTDDHLDAMGRMLLLGSLVMSISYMTEWFLAWYAGSPTERSLTAFLFSGETAPFYLAMLACNCAIPQLLWFPGMRRTPIRLLVIALLINVGMFLERILIIVNTLTRGFVPAQWSFYVPTFWDWALLVGTIGLFALLFLVLVRIVPVVSMHEVRRLQREVNEP